MQFQYGGKGVNSRVYKYIHNISLFKENTFILIEITSTPPALVELLSDQQTGVIRQPSSLSMCSCVTDKQHGGENEHACSANLPWIGLKNKKNPDL